MNPYRISEISVQSSSADIRLDGDFKVTEWSKASSDFLKISRNDAMKRDFFDLVEFENSDDLLKNMAGISPNQSIGITLQGGTGNSCRRFIFTLAKDIRGRVNGFAIHIHDIIEVCSHERELIKVRKNLEDIFAHAPIGIFSANIDGKLLSANPEFAWMLGYESCGHLIDGVSDISSQLFFNDDRAESFLFQLFEAEQVNRFKCRLKRRDGSGLWSLCYAKITHDISGRKSGFYGFSVDISATVRAEKALQKVNEELKLISILDGLTKIPNRRRFDEYLDIEWKRGRRNRTPISLIICDIDYFKKYNDTYGHQTGDDCLISVAEAIEGSVNRPPDLAARYGGEEFAVVLPNTRQGGAVHVAEIIRRAVNELRIPHSSSMVAEYVTLSLGVASAIPGGRCSPGELLKRADMALYNAKKGGRNRVMESL